MPIIKTTPNSNLCVWVVALLCYLLLSVNYDNGENKMEQTLLRESLKMELGGHWGNEAFMQFSVLELLFSHWPGLISAQGQTRNILDQWLLHGHV